MGANDQVGTGPRPGDAVTVEMPRIYDDANRIRRELHRTADEAAAAVLVDEQLDAMLPALAIRIYPDNGPSINIEWRDVPEHADAIVLADAFIRRTAPARV
jgi:hypothetical protein